MKKITLIAAVVIAASFASCKKVYTCTCSYTYGGQTYSETYSTGTKVKKKTAETWCTSNSGYSDETCVLNK